MPSVSYLVMSPQEKPINRVLWDGKTLFNPGEGLTLVLDDGRDFLGELSHPVIPQTVTLFQLRSAMLATPEIYSVFNVSTMPPTVAQAWQFAGDVSRTGTLATAIASTCNLSPSAMDDLFLAASQITA